MEFYRLCLSKSAPAGAEFSMSGATQQGEVRQTISLSSCARGTAAKESDLSKFQCFVKSPHACRAFSKELTSRAKFLSIPVLAIDLKCNVPEHKQFMLPTTGLTMAHAAAYVDYLEALAEIVKEDQQIVITPTSDGYIPLHYACAGGSVECAAYLLVTMSKLDMSRGEWVAMEHNVPKSAYYLAAFVKSPKILALLRRFEYALVASDQARVAGAVLRNKDMESLQVIYPLVRELRDLVETAMRARNFEAVRFFIQDGQPIDRTGFSGLQLACTFEDTAETVELIREICLHTPSFGEVGETGPIHWVCGLGNFSVLEMLVQKGIDVNHRDKMGRSGPEYLLPLGKSPDEVIRWLECLARHGWKSSVPGTKSFLGAVLTCRHVKKYARVILWLLQRGVHLSQSVDLEHQETCQERIEKMIADDDFWREMLERDFVKVLAQD